MKIKGKFTALLDGDRVYDVNLVVNSRSKKYVIISCNSKQNAIDFISEFEKLLDKYTIDRVESIDMEMGKEGEI